MVFNSSGYRQVLTGDDNCYTWFLTVDNSIADQANGYACRMDLSGVALTENYTKGELRTLVLYTNSELGSEIDYSINLDGNARGSAKLTEAGTTATLGSFVLGTDVLGGSEIEKVYRKIGGRGTVVELTFENSAEGADMKLMDIALTTKDLRSY